MVVPHEQLIELGKTEGEGISAGSTGCLCVIILREADTCAANT